MFITQSIDQPPHAVRLSLSEGKRVSIFFGFDGTKSPDPCVYICAPHIMGREICLRLHQIRNGKKEAPSFWSWSLLEDQPRHGYDIAKLIQIRSNGVLRFHVTSLYPLLYRLEERGWIDSRWVEKAEQRRRRYYSLTPEGRKVLRSQRKSWKEFVAAMGRVTGVEHA